jgi:hypothetical protein
LALDVDRRVEDRLAVAADGDEPLGIDDPAGIVGPVGGLAGSGEHGKLGRVQLELADDSPPEGATGGSQVARRAVARSAHRAV